MAGKNMAAQTKSLVAFVHVAGVQRSIDFYADLGFKVANTVVPKGQSMPVWAWLESEKANLMLGLADGPVDASQQAIRSLIPKKGFVPRALNSWDPS